MLGWKTELDLGNINIELISLNSDRGGRGQRNLGDFPHCSVSFRKCLERRKGETRKGKKDSENP